jgi:hypothetical protein
LDGDHAASGRIGEFRAIQAGVGHRKEGYGHGAFLEVRIVFLPQLPQTFRTSGLSAGTHGNRECDEFRQSAASHGGHQDTRSFLSRGQYEFAHRLPGLCDSRMVRNSVGGLRESAFHVEPGSAEYIAHRQVCMRKVHGDQSARVERTAHKRRIVAGAA